MNYVLGLIGVIIVAVILRKILRYKTLYPFLPRKYNFGKRRDTLRETMRLLEVRKARRLVETGAARGGLAKSKGDGASTVVFGLWASQHGAHLHSVDIDPAATEEAGNAVRAMGLAEHVTLVTSDSVAFLASYTEPVDFLYLDSYDYHKTDVEIQKASQEHHLKEINAVQGRLHDNSVILIDDCGQPGGGKGKLVIDKLTAEGWRVHMSEYQVILVKDGY